MNLLGKIITIMILLLSVCFLMISVMVGASHQNWKQQAIDNKELVEQFAQEKRQILEEIEKKERTIRTEKVARMLRIQQLESQVQLAIQDYQAKEKELSEQLVISQERLAVAKEANERLAEQDKEVSNLRDQLKTLIQDVATQREKVVAMTNRIYELEGAKRNLEARREELASEVAQRTKVMKKHDLTPTDLTSDIEPRVEGEIVDVQQNTIEINIGTDDGIKNGHTVDIIRDDNFVGTAQVILAQPNRSAARVNPDLTTASPQNGDKVTTKWVRSHK